MNKHSLIALSISAALVAGCGGGGDAPPAFDPTEAVPDSASASAAGLVAYLRQLTALLVDDKEPVDLSRFAPMRVEDAEPEALR